jgi:ABC-type lipoprotein release transport system permease subunit
LRGRTPAVGPVHELVLGATLARALGLDVGDVLPPFYRNDAGERVSTVVGVLDGGPPWRQALVLTSFESAEHIAGGGGAATDVLVRCRPGYGDTVAQTVGRLSWPSADGAALTLRATPRDHSESTLIDGPVRTHSVFDAHFVLAFAVGIPLLLVTSGVGLAARRREAGLLRALGWSMETLLLRGVAEGALLAVLGAAGSVLLAALWLGPCGGAFVAELYLPGMVDLPGATVPYRLTGAPTLLATGIALVLTLTGGVVSVWRAAAASPAEAMT